MSRPPLEVADLIRAAGTSFFDHSHNWFTWLHLKILTAIVCCRTSALGGHIDECSGCGHRAISFNSCRNRHCPKCQSNARDRWLEARRRELLPVPYAHVVFTLPGQLAPLAISNHRLVALEDREVVFRWRDSAHKNKKRLMRLALDEFLRRFFLHVLPRGFVRIRHFGLFAHRRRAALLPLCFALLRQKANDYDLLFVISTLSRAGTPAPNPCPPPAVSAS
jgi:hypothetical protein